MSRALEQEQPLYVEKKDGMRLQSENSTECHSPTRLSLNVISQEDVFLNGK